MICESDDFSPLAHGGLNMFTPIPDFSLTILLMYVFFYGLIAFTLVVLAEAFAFWLLEWGSFLRSLRDSVLANFVTTILGVFLYITYHPPWLDIFDEANIASNMFICWVLSVAVESLALYTISRKSFKEIVPTSSITNTFSYIPLYLCIHTLFS
jgi:hypothetical protein